MPLRLPVSIGPLVVLPFVLSLFPLEEEEFFGEKEEVEPVVLAAL